MKADHRMVDHLGRKPPRRYTTLETPPETEWENPPHAKKWPCCTGSYIGNRCLADFQGQWEGKKGNILTGNQRFSNEIWDFPDFCSLKPINFLGRCFWESPQIQYGRIFDTVATSSDPEIPIVCGHFECPGPSSSIYG